MSKVFNYSGLYIVFITCFVTEISAAEIDLVVPEKKRRLSVISLPSDLIYQDDIEMQNSAKKVPEFFNINIPEKDNKKNIEDNYENYEILKESGCIKSYLYNTTKCYFIGQYMFRTAGFGFNITTALFTTLSYATEEVHSRKTFSFLAVISALGALTCNKFADYSAANAPKRAKTYQKIYGKSIVQHKTAKKQSLSKWDKVKALFSKQNK
ncbi:MAG: hypothetical protein ACTSXG_02365 [Alphaproteobacteria bacterium]